MSKLLNKNEPLKWRSTKSAYSFETKQKIPPNHQGKYFSRKKCGCLHILCCRGAVPISSTERAPGGCVVSAGMVLPGCRTPLLQLTTRALLLR